MRTSKKLFITIVGVLGTGAHIYVYIGPGAQFKDG